MSKLSLLLVFLHAIIIICSDSDTKDVNPIFRQTKTQTEAPKSVIKPGYGILYNSYGILLHGLNRYNLVIGLHMPQIKFHLNRPVTYFKDYLEHCRHLSALPKVFKLCVEVWPLYFYYLQQKLTYQKTIQQIMCLDLPAMLPGYEPPSQLCTIQLPNIDTTGPLNQYNLISYTTTIHNNNTITEHRTPPPLIGDTPLNINDKTNIPSGSLAHLPLIPGTISTGIRRQRQMYGITSNQKNSRQRHKDQETRDSFQHCYLLHMMFLKPTYHTNQTRNC